MKKKMSRHCGIQPLAGKKLLLTSLVLVFCLGLTGCFNNTTTEETNANAGEEPKTLTLYTYDSLSAEWGLLPLILDQFEQENDLEVEVVSFADTGSMLNQLILEKAAPKADIVLGLDNVDYQKVVSNDLLTPYQPTGYKNIAPGLLFDEEGTMTPFDYGYVGFVYNSEEIEFEEPIFLNDLASEEYKDKIIIEQPGLSSPGTQLLLWSDAALSETEFNNFWTNLNNNLLTVTPDWSTAYYSMFMEGEAPIVLSYLTSPAYHIAFDETDVYKALPIKDGYVRQVEGVGVVNGATNETGAKKFIDYILTDNVQSQIGETQWMFPVLGDETTWPEAYSEIIIPENNEVLEVNESDAENLIEKWNSIFGV
ncbi:MAG: thiamine ABC transporter substrate-binding protein [Patescibacteria group bacterium]